MFQHITVLFSFVFAIALTHVLSCVSKLILARDRVRFSGLHALWMLNDGLRSDVIALRLKVRAALKSKGRGDYAPASASKSVAL